MRIAEQKLANEQLPRLLVLHDKHGDETFEATGDKLRWAALQVVKRRMEQGWYYDPGTLEDYCEPRSYDRNPNPEFIDDETFRTKTFEKRAEEWKALDKEWRFLVRLIEDNNGGKALVLLEHRRDHEYEGFEIVYPTEADRPIEPDNPNGE